MTELLSSWFYKLTSCNFFRKWKWTNNHVLCQEFHFISADNCALQSVKHALLHFLHMEYHNKRRNRLPHLLLPTDLNQIDSEGVRTANQKLKTNAILLSMHKSNNDLSYCVNCYFVRLFPAHREKLSLQYLGQVFKN